MKRDTNLKKIKRSKRSFNEKVEQFDFFATIAEFLVLIPRAIWQVLK